MSDDDLIRRGDAKAELERHAKGGTTIGGQTFRTIQLGEATEAIRALPAITPGVRVRKLEWVDFYDRGAKAQAWNEANYMIQRWSDGRYEISASYPGYSTFIEGTDRFYPTIEAAKAAAQADYEARILAALDLTPQPVPDVAGLRVAMVTSSLWIDEQEGRAGDFPDEPCVVLSGSLDAVRRTGKLLGKKVALAAMEGKP